MKIQSLAYNSDYDDPKKARKPGAVRPAPSPSGLSVGGGGSSSGGTTINSTNGQLPYRVNSTTFGDSAIASNALNSTYLSVTSGASGAGVTVAVAGGGTNENLILSPKGNASTLFRNTAVGSVRETIVKATVSDGGNSAFFIANGSASDSVFLPSVSGLNEDSTRPSLLFNGFVTSTYDTGGSVNGNALVRFSAVKTNSSTDPLNGTLSSVSSRNLFGFAGVDGGGSPVDYMVVDPSGRVGIGTVAPSSSLHLGAASGANTITLNTATAAKARIGTIGGLSNWTAFSLNSNFIGGSWSLDDTTADGWVFKLDTRTLGASSNNGLWLFRVPAGANPHGDEYAAFGITNGNGYFRDALVIGGSVNSAAQLDVLSGSTTRPAARFQAASGTSGGQEMLGVYDGSGGKVWGVQADGTFMPVGGTSASFPALKRSTTTLQVRLADDSDFAAIQSLYIRFGSGSPEGVVTAPVGAIYSRTDGGAGTSLYVKESGTGNTGWVAK